MGILPAERGILPRDWNEKLYLLVNPDVQGEIARGTYSSGYHHYLVAGKAEHRKGGFIPPDWHETSYLQTNLDAFTSRSAASGPARPGVMSTSCSPC